MNPHPFDVDAAFGEDYLHFYRHMLGEQRAEADTDAAVELGALRPGMRVLDAPCGTGRMAVRFAERGMVVTGIDRSAEFLAVAAAAADERGVAVDLRHGDLRTLPVEGPFDAVVCWFTSFGYFSDDENHEVLREFRRVLAPGGVLLVDTLSHDGYVRSFTESPEAIVVDVDGDLMIDRNLFDVETGCIVCHRVTVRGGTRREARFFIRLPTIPEWHRWLRAAGFASVHVTDPFGAPVDLDAGRLVVRAVA